MQYLAKYTFCSRLVPVQSVAITDESFVSTVIMLPRLFTEAPSGTIPTVSTLLFKIANLMKIKPFEALNAFNQMAIENHKIDLISLSNGLVIAINLGHLLLGKAIHGFILRKEVNLDLVGTTTLIDMYGKCGHLSGGMNPVIYTMDFFNKTGNVSQNGSEGPGMENNTDIANQLISMYSKCNLILSARVVFDMTKNKDRVSWTSIIRSYVSHGHDDEAIALFRLMQTSCIRTDCVTFTCLIQAASHLKFLMEATIVMEHDGMEVGERVGKWLLEVELGSASAYCSVSNPFAVGGRWDGVASIGAVAKEKGLRSATGYSLVDAN
ncbi:pentatricopeptide repeat-containing protein At4g30700-like [Andrographis paniculata]|uniref:pentatricopeptide repeat-containing protein At4g30700-like n=1 Tax=Andrographis paniculata TaxID=175694 RepID=UPI0021E8AA1B|nr:pentatricopeptide repeat-containing protein At4g30700-like [Andrographis paniculata]